MANGPRSIEQRLLEADAMAEDLAHRLHEAQGVVADLLRMTKGLILVVVAETGALFLLTLYLNLGAQQ